MPNYTYADIYAKLNGRIHAKILNLEDPRETINSAVNFVTGDIDLRSCKRKATASPNIFDDIYDYACPTDLKGIALIDVIPQVNRPIDSEIELTTEEQFDRKKTINKLMVAFSDDSFMRKIRISMNVDDDSFTIAELDSLSSGGGTWALFGDAENVAVDGDDYVRGSGSIKWDISSAGGTTAGIQNSTLDEFDITDYLSAGSIFVFAKITSTTNLTNYILRVGNDSSNYYTKTVTADHAGNAFHVGWNLLRFDLQSATQTGTVAPTTCDYVAVYMTKAGAKISETDYKFDWIVMKRGQIHEVLYYSKYAWQTAAGVWIENSTVDGDYINVDTEELELIMTKATEMGAQELRDYEDEDRQIKKYAGLKADYLIKHPSEAKLLTNQYYNV
jgi:hypothetical protein